MHWWRYIYNFTGKTCEKLDDANLTWSCLDETERVVGSTCTPSCINEKEISNGSYTTCHADLGKRRGRWDPNPHNFKCLPEGQGQGATLWIVPVVIAVVVVLVLAFLLKKTNKKSGVTHAGSAGRMVLSRCSLHLQIHSFFHKDNLIWAASLRFAKKLRTIKEQSINQSININQYQSIYNQHTTFFIPLCWEAIEIIFNLRCSRTF